MLKKAKTKSSSSTFLFAIGFPIACEGDIDGALGGLIGKLLGCGPVYLSDWLEHDSNTVTLWHGGMAPVQVYVRRKSQTDFKNNSAARGSGLNHRQKVQSLVAEYLGIFLDFSVEFLHFFLDFLLSIQPTVCNVLLVI